MLRQTLSLRLIGFKLNRLAHVFHEKAGTCQVIETSVWFTDQAALAAARNLTRSSCFHSHSIEGRFTLPGAYWGPTSSGAAICATASKGQDVWRSHPDWNVLCQFSLAALQTRSADHDDLILFREFSRNLCLPSTFMFTNKALSR